ncbi:MAG: SH3 domain-containing protein, partial [Nitrospinota bacterium]|nr:SH3 domain-containing protein [Nitrospinota bacterium]
MKCFIDSLNSDNITDIQLKNWKVSIWSLGMKAFLRSAVCFFLVAIFVVSTAQAQTLIVRVPKGNVRARPQTTSPIVGKVKRGEQYDVEVRQGDWFKILLETGEEGWVFKSLVEVSGRSKATSRT